MVTADDKAVRCLQDLKNVYNLKSVGIAEITIEFQLRSLLSDEEAQIPTQNVKYPREIGFEDSDLYTDDPEEAYCEGNTSQNITDSMSRLISSIENVSLPPIEPVHEEEKESSDSETSDLTVCTMDSDLKDEDMLTVEEVPAAETSPNGTEGRRKKKR